MNKLLKFDNGANRLKTVAEKRRDEGDILGAVSAYRSVLEKSPFDYDANADLAELYAEADLCMEAANCWFRALSVAADKYEEARAYNGLGAAHYFLGMDLLALHYFGKQLSLDQETDYEYNDVIEDIQDEAYDENERRPYFVVYDKTKDDEGEKSIKRARALIEEGKLNEALTSLTQIKDDSPHFVRSLEMIAFVLFLQGKYETATEIADHILYLDGNNFRARYVLCSCLYGKGETEKSEVFFKQLVAEAEEKFDEERYLHMIMLSLDTSHESVALRFIERVLEETPYNLNVLYVRGLVKYNLGDVEGCRADLKKVLVFTDNAVVRDKLSVAGKAEGERPDRIEYEFDLKESEVKYRVEELNKRFDALRESGSISFEDIREHCDCIVKCRFGDLFAVGMQMGLAVDARRTHEYLKELLLDVSVSDEIKCSILREYLTLGVNMPIKCVTAHIYKEFTLSRYEFNGFAAELFNEVYAIAAACLYMVADDKVPLLRRRLKKYKEIYEYNGYPDSAEPKPLAAAAFHLMKLPGISAKGIVRELFSVEEKEFNEAVISLTPREEL
ncbi:MAG: hypothetical protein IJU84_07800 [Clostridia bacterium]|nr:hypothetical protein [Clostridia bacterium]